MTITATLPPSPPLEDGRPSHKTRTFSIAEVRWASVALLLFTIGLALHVSSMPEWTYWAAYLACYLAGGWEPALEGLRALRHKTLDVDLLMIVAAIGAAGIGQVFDGALLIVIFATSGALEAVLTQRTADSIRGLLSLSPEQALRVDAEGVQTTVDASDLAIGDTIIVRPGERIGGDGRVVSGASEVDQSTITGESVSAQKRAGDAVYAGTMNGTGMLTVEVIRDPADTIIARIVAMVHDASSTKAKTQLFIERVEQYYSSIVVASTVAIFVLPLLFGAHLESALLRAMTFMIVASPCAVVLATMPPLLAAMATAARNGVLVKSAVVMERLREIDLVVFDKTGTLTEGMPRVHTVCALPGADIEPADILALAGAVERHSEHPLATAITDAAWRSDDKLETATDFASTPGIGVHGFVAGRRIDLSRPHMCPLTPAARALVDELEQSGHTVVLVGIDNTAVGLLGLRDTIRTESSQAVAQITQLTGQRPILLSGDNQQVATATAAGVGITDARAGLLPDAKAAAVQELRDHGYAVLVVGDGVNDAPALATAHTGVAMGRRGSDLTLDTADAVLIHDDLRGLVGVLKLSRRAHRIVIANLAIAATFIVTLVIWDLTATLPLPLGVAGHETSTVIVALNGMRLLSQRSWSTQAS
ncbi:heavy metal translocating P-type ATPase [Williamsia soli]|uniref:heavy metal translocating P-type ATPase n=1 Tax=Williamsia soli TaxID=364929 RepID=UPI001A9CD7B7|nr:heavy metal translocating P-type ATPase [Williamsia soli]